MMFKTIFTNILHQSLQVIHLGDSYASIHSIRVIRDFTSTQISLDSAFCIICGNTEECEITFGHFTIYGTECIDLAQRKIGRASCRERV